MSFTENQLMSGEQIILITHQHPIVLLRWLLIDLVSVVILVGIAIATGNFWPLILLIIPSSILAYDIIARHRKEYIITDRRVVKQEGIFTIHSFDAPLDKINNVFHEQNFVGRILNYGQVGLETASEQGTTIFHLIPSPVSFKNRIVEQRESYRSGTREPTTSSSSRETVLRLLDELANLRDRKVITAEEFDLKKRELLGRL